MGSSSSKVEQEETVKVFWSGHLTDGHAERRQQWLAPVNESMAEIRASMPPFNNAKKFVVPSFVDPYNVPAFGPSIANAVMRIYAWDHMKNIAHGLKVPLLECTLSKFIQDKMPKVHDMIKHCRDNPEIVGGNLAAVDKLEAFVTEFEALGPTSIKDMKEWEQFVGKHVAPGWQAKLHFDHLLGNFGFDRESSDALGKVMFTKPDGEEVTFVQHSFRWLSKALAAYGPEGALTDVVNAVFALTGETYTTDLTDVAIAQKIDAFAEKIMAGKVADLWIPSHFFMDAEVDDCLVWILLEYLHQAKISDECGICCSQAKAPKGRKPRLHVLIQLPADADFDNLAKRWRNLPNCEVWRDPDARNAKAVKTLHMKAREGT